MTVPALIQELPSMAQVMEARGETPGPAYQCRCRRVLPADGFVCTDDLSDPELPRFLCLTCVSHPFRLARAAADAQVRAAAGPDWADARARRDILLTRCDWTQVADAPLSDEVRLAWAAYRQALRDVTRADHPDDVAWPEPPA